METRWTATVIKDTDGKWRVLTLHIGTNFLDNPILTEAEASLLYFAGGGLLMGLLLSGLIGFIVSRLKRKRDN
jgi:NhaP-type Na+/H+ or K+/H+ antiporter